MYTRKEGKWIRKPFSMLDYLVHFGMAINIILIIMLVWYGIS